MYLSHTSKQSQEQELPWPPGTIIIDKGAPLAPGTIIIDKGAPLAPGTIIIDKGAPLAPWHYYY